MTPSPETRFLDPAALHAVGDLALVSKVVVDGLLAGLHPGSRPAAGVEFGGYRPYQSGDDLRRVDWRLWARSDRYWVRLADVEREITVRILLDGTRSMAHRDAGGLAKFDYARILTATLARLAERQGDRFALHLLSDSCLEELDPGHHRSAMGVLLHKLAEIEPRGCWPAAGELAERVSRLRRRELVVLISDLHEAGSEIRAALARIRSLGHEVVVFHLMARNELDLGFEGPVQFEDLETGATLRADADRLRPRYLELLEEHREELRRDLLASGVALHSVALDEPLDLVLRSFLLRRLASS